MDIANALEIVLELARDALPDCPILRAHLEEAIEVVSATYEELRELAPSVEDR